MSISIISETLINNTFYLQFNSLLDKMKKQGDERRYYEKTII